MLFTFKKPGSYCFWMKDMKFPVDIIWLNTNGVITGLESNVSPQTYPRSYCGAAGTTKVLELPAGSIQRNQLTTGNPLML